MDEHLTSWRYLVGLTNFPRGPRGCSPYRISLLREFWWVFYFYFYCVMSLGVWTRMFSYMPDLGGLEALDHLFRHRNSA